MRRLVAAEKIIPPKQDKRRRLARAGAEATAQLFGPAAALATLYRVTHPSADEIELDRWVQDVTARLNSGDTKVAYKLSGQVNSINISAVADVGVGEYKITFIAPYLGANYLVTCAAENASVRITAREATSVRLSIVRDGLPADADFWVRIDS